MLKKLASLAKDALTYGASNVMSQIVGFLLLPIYTSRLSPADYGVIAMLAIASTLFVYIASLGLPNAMLRFVVGADDPEARARLVRTTTTTVLAATVILSAAGVAAAAPISAALTGTAQYVLETRIAIVGAACGAVAGVPTTLLRAERRVTSIALVNIAKLMIQVAVSVWLVVGRDLLALGVLTGTLAGEGAGLLALCALAYRQAPLGFHWPTSRRLHAYGLPLLPHQFLAIALTLFGQYVVRDMLGLSQAGLYGIAMKFAAPVTLVVGALQRAWVPFKLEVHAQDGGAREFFASATTYFAAALAFLWIGVSVWVPELLSFATDPRYHEARTLVPLAALVPLSNGLYMIAGTGMEIHTDTRPFFLISLTGLLVVVIGTVALVGPFGAAGAMTATAAGWLAMAAVVNRLAATRYPIAFQWPTLGGILGVAVAVVGVHAMAPSLGVRIALAVGATLGFPIVVLALLSVTPAERARVARLWSRLRGLRSRATSRASVEEG